MNLSVKKESKLLLKHSMIYGLGTMMTNLAAFLLLPVYTRYLNTSEYGVKELVGLSTQIISILVATTISSAMYRFYFEYEKEKERNEVISTSYIAIGIAGMVILGTLIILSRKISALVMSTEDYYIYFGLSFASLWFQTIINISYNYLKVQKKSLLFIVVNISKLLMAIGLNIYLIVFLHYGLLGIFLSTLFTSVTFSVLLGIPILHKTGLSFSFSKFKEMLKYGLPMIPSQLGAFIVHLSDRFFIKSFASLSETGIYALGYRFGAIPSNFISSPFNQIWQPRRFELYKQEGSEKIFGKIFTYFLFLMLFAGLFVAGLTKDILMIMAKPEFWPAYKIVPIIVLATTIFSMHYHLNMGILISKKTKYLAYVNFSNGLLVLVLNYILIKHYGMWGAAITTLIAFIYKVSLIYYFSSKFYKIYFELLRIVKIVLVFIVLYFVTLLVHSESIFYSLIIKSLIILTFPIVLYVIGFFSSEEKKSMVQFFNNALNRTI